jgi:hypothetical protein
MLSVMVLVSNLFLISSLCNHLKVTPSSDLRSLMCAASILLVPSHDPCSLCLDTILCNFSKIFSRFGFEMHFHNSIYSYEEP